MSLVFVVLAKNLNTVVVDYKIINNESAINIKTKEKSIFFYFVKKLIKITFLFSNALKLSELLIKPLLLPIF